MTIKYKKFFSPIFIIISSFGIIFCLISLVNHFNYRTYAFDLGLFNNELFDNAHLRSNNYVLMGDQFSNPLADHFSLVTPLFSPLYWIFGSYTMLIVQIVFVLFGGYGIFKYFKTKFTAQSRMPELAVIHFFLIWGIYSAIGYDYHDNVIAAMLVPWFIYYFEQDEKIKSFFLLLAILITKENMALWAVFICIGLAISKRKEKRFYIKAMLYAIISGIYFILIVKFVMPRIGTIHPEAGYHHFKYSCLGSNINESIQNIFTHPIHFLKLYFINHLGMPDASGIKRELYITLFLSGGIALIIYPRYFIMLIPIITQKVLSDDYGKWGLNYQYSIEFAPILSIALFMWISSLANKSNSLIFTTIFLTSTAITTFYTLEHRVSKWYSPNNFQFYDLQHYSCDFNRKDLNTALSLIPDTASVSASSQIVPHLAFRNIIYQFPTVNNANYILLVDGEPNYPLNSIEFNLKLNEYVNSLDWELIYNSNPIYLFHKISKNNRSYFEHLFSSHDMDSIIFNDKYTLIDNEFSESITIKDDIFNGFTGSKIISKAVFEIPFDYKLLKGSVFLVTSLESANETYFYNAVDLINFIQYPDNIRKVFSINEIPTLKPNSCLKIYIWNKLKSPIILKEIRVAKKN